MLQDKINCTLRVRCCFIHLTCQEVWPAFRKRILCYFWRKSSILSISSHRPLSKYILVLISTFSQSTSRVCVLGKGRPPIFSLQSISMSKALRAHAFLFWNASRLFTEQRLSTWFQSLTVWALSAVKRDKT